MIEEPELDPVLPAFGGIVFYVEVTAESGD
jgi:hypothetical protein